MKKTIQETWKVAIKQPTRKRHCLLCGKETKKGETIHVMHEMCSMTCVCDNCYTKNGKGQDE